MLVVLDGLLVEIEPVPVPVTHFAFRKLGNKLDVLADSRPIESGVRFYAMDNYGSIDPISGEFSVKNGCKARFRAIFANKSMDVVVPAG